MAYAIPKPRKMLRKVIELYSAGYNYPDIARVLKKDLGEEVSTSSIKNMVRKQLIYKKQVIQTDKKYKEIHKELLLKFLLKIEENTKILEGLREFLQSRFNELKEDIPESKLMNFSKEIMATIRTQNDTIRTLNELLKRMETETSELTINQVQATQETLKILEDLEKMGYIKINEKFKKNELYKTKDNS